MNIEAKNQYNQKISVTIKKGKIKKIKEIKTNRKIDKYIIPGFIDIHSYGGYWFDWKIGFVENSKLFLNKISFNEGVTSILGVANFNDANLIEKFKPLILDPFKNCANFLGWYIEWNSNLNILSNNKKTNLVSSRKEDIFNTNEIIDVFKSNIKYIKIASIFQDNFTNDAISFLSKNRISCFSNAKTNLNKNNFNLKVDAGLIGVSNFHNLNQKLSSNDFWKNFLFSQKTYLEFLNDEIYNNNINSKLIYESKIIDKIILITNSIYFKGLKSGNYSYLDEKIIKDKEAVYTDKGELYGSVHSMHQAFKNWIKNGASMSEAIRATSTNAAELLNLKKGKIKTEYDADFLILNSNLEILKTYVNGKRIKKNFSK